MAIGYSRYLKRIYLLGDLLMLNMAFCGVSFYFKWPNLHADTSFLAQFIYINIFWLLVTLLTRVSEIDRGLRYDQIAGLMVRAMLLFTFLLVTFLYLTDEFLIPVFHFEIKLVVFAFLFFLWRTIMSGILNFIRRRGLNYRNVIIVGNGQPAREMEKFFVTHPEVGYRLKGIFCDTDGTSGKSDITGSLMESQSFALANNIDEIYCSISGLPVDRVTELMEFADRSLIRFKIIPDFSGFLNKKVSVDFYEFVPVLSVRNEPLENYLNQLQKRAFDIFVALFALLIVLPPVLLVIVPVILFTSRGPVFFRQSRSGLNNKVFTCYKFRTMKVNSDADVVQASAGDSRVTGFGRFLRKTSLDELPQFFNVLMGHMSVVGPRPHMLLHTAQYSGMINKFMVRHLVKPGITGWAQIHGLRGETRDPEKMKRRVEYDVWYIENWSFLLDIKIVFVTIFKSLMYKGI